MNWKRILLVVVVGFFALVFLAVAAAGCAATAALGTAAAVISDSGVVQAFEEVADGAERLQIEASENALTFTDLDTGESRTIKSGDRLGNGRVEFSLPELTITAEEGNPGSVQVLGQRGQVELQATGQEGRITVTGPEGEHARIVIPDGGRRGEMLEVTVPRVEFDDSHYWRYDLDRQFEGLYGLRIVGEIFRGIFTLVALVLIAAGAYVLLRNRRRNQETLDQVKGESDN